MIYTVKNSGRSKWTRNPEIMKYVSATTRGEVEDIIREKKITNLKDLCEIAKVGDKCGGCREDLQMILDDVLAE